MLPKRICKKPDRPLRYFRVFLVQKLARLVQTNFRDRCGETRVDNEANLCVVHRKTTHESMRVPTGAEKRGLKENSCKTHTKCVGVERHILLY